jgi:DNA-binding CsgD family transcriptional regulator
LDPVTSHAIDVVEACYDLEKSDAGWLPNIMEVGAPVFDHGLGVFGFEFVRPVGASGAESVVRGMQMEGLPADFQQRFEAARGVLSADFVRTVTPPGYAGTWSEISASHPEEFRRLVDMLGYSDLLGIVAVDPNGVGVDISAPLPEAVKLTPRSRERWQMVGAHIAAAYRLRRALKTSAKRPRTELPNGAEAVLDTKGFRLVHAAGDATATSAADILRRAARRADRARGRLRYENPARALAAWQALVSGRWSVVDWFDTDQRRFVLAIPNPPKVGDPRGLTPQECLVVAYAVLGESNKLIAYRLGLSQGRVSGLLRSAIHKLGLKSRTQLVQQIGPLGSPTDLPKDESAA